LIRYTPQAQLTLEGFQTPFSQHLDKENRWVKLAHSIPWDKLANIYYRKMNSDFGAPSLSARMVIGAVIIKHMLNIDDREVVSQIQENMYLQYFVGLSSFSTAEPFDPSLMVSIRYRLGQDVMEEFNQLVLQHAGVIALPTKDKKEGSAPANENKSSDTSKDANQSTDKDKEEQNIEQSNDSKPDNTPGGGNASAANSGTLLLDATVAEQQIEYPTDLKLLNESRQQLERMVRKVCKEGKLRQPRMYKNKARQQYLSIAKKKKKTKKDIRKGLRSQLQHVSRDIKYVDKLLGQHTTLKSALDKRDWQAVACHTHEVYRRTTGQCFAHRVRQQPHCNRVRSVTRRCASH
jgi:hypothetical protein